MTELGVFVFENWRGAKEGYPARDTLEYPLFSDARIVGEITEGLGPYQILNCIADPSLDPQRPVLVLRISYHMGWSYGEMEATDTTRYHGGTVSDEIAALVSLSLGVRLKAGSAHRWFSVNGDPRGRPWSFRESRRADPIVLHSGLDAVLPQAQGEHSLAAFPRLVRFSELSPADSIAVVRAARLYQDAVWIAESEPALSWLMLVSAVETAAGQWRRGKELPRKRLQASRPQLDALLIQYGGDELAAQVAEMIADSLGATKKFVDFCMAFLPSEPPQRPDALWRVPWSRSKMRDALSKIYSYRSLALHAGTPFPAPMTMPNLVVRGESYAERPPSGSAGALGGVWVNGDLPMYLHVFEYIARNALLSWWDSLLPDSSASEVP